MTGSCGDEVCITCSDQLLPVVVEAVLGDGSLARGHQDGQPCEISIELVDDVRAGDVVLVHGGVALQRAEATIPGDVG